MGFGIQKGTQMPDALLAKAVLGTIGFFLVQGFYLVAIWPKLNGGGIHIKSSKVSLCHKVLCPTENGHFFLPSF